MKSKNNITIEKSVKNSMLLFFYQLLVFSGILVGFLWVARYFSPFYAIYHLFFKFVIEESRNVKLALTILDVPFVAIVGIAVCVYIFKKTFSQLRSAYSIEPFSLIRFTPHTFVFFVLVGVVLQRLSLIYILIFFWM
jgi:phosphoglycerol transferase MdoB-like AlkP superfamily enzyme